MNKSLITAITACVATAGFLVSYGNGDSTQGHLHVPGAFDNYKIAKAPNTPGIDQGTPSLSLISSTTIAALINGTLVFTNNNGKSWTTKPLPPHANPEAIDFVNSHTGWLLAWAGTSWNHPTIYKTRDGGRHWQRQFEAPRAIDQGTLDMISTENGWAILANRLYHTRDGGTHWTQIRLPSGDIPVGLDFVNSTKGWVSARSPRAIPIESLLATNDGLHFHTILTTSHSISAMSLQSHGSGEVLEGAPGGYMAFGPLLKTTNDGKQWLTITPSTHFSQLHVFGYASAMAFDGETGWIGTTNGALGFVPDGLMVTNNDGKTWHFAKNQDGWAIQAIKMTGLGEGWVIAHAASGVDFLAHTVDNGQHWTISWPPKTPNSLDFITPQIGYGMGVPSDNKAIVFTKDGGQQWTCQTSTTPKTFNAYAFSPTLGLAAFDTYVGPQAEQVAQLYASHNGGRTWQKSSLLPHLTVLAIQYLGKGVWMMRVQTNMGLSNQLELSTDNGRHWTRLKLHLTSADMVSMVNPHQLWIFAPPTKDTSATTNSLVLETTTGFIQNTALTFYSSHRITYDVNGIDFRNTQNGWVMVTKFVQSSKLIHKPGPIKKLVHAAPKLYNLLYETTDGGRHWTIWQLPPSWNVTGMDLVSTRTGYLIVNGTLVKTTDGGEQWHLAAP
ncbi:YCF48-related protein [Sulfobacillus thermosulfidooxidans]|uniref:YCF48-related protein n=1 Tax=Sulfobacillus thermosulfidooxidans TaxID=28034 RepID=UPI0002FF6016|nr:YCF48-related protein [Sulfobacillus thermosulfidooxidans]